MTSSVFHNLFNEFLTKKYFLDLTCKDSSLKNFDCNLSHDWIFWLKLYGWTPWSRFDAMASDVNYNLTSASTWLNSSVQRSDKFCQFVEHAVLGAVWNKFISIFLEASSRPCDTICRHFASRLMWNVVVLSIFLTSYYAMQISGSLYEPDIVPWRQIATKASYFTNFKRKT